MTLRGRRRYWDLQLKALDRTCSRTLFGMGYWQTTFWGSASLLAYIAFNIILIYHCQVDLFDTNVTAPFSRYRDEVVWNNGGKYPFATTITHTFNWSFYCITPEERNTSTAVGHWDQKFYICFFVSLLLAQVETAADAFAMPTHKYFDFIT
jgi:hypothetical protein